MAELIGVLLGYVESIATLSYLFRRREKNTANAKLFKDAEDIAESIEGSVDEISQSTNLDPATQAQLQAVSASLCDTQNLFSAVKGRKKISYAVDQFQREADTLQLLASKLKEDGRPLRNLSACTDDQGKTDPLLPKIVVSEYSGLSYGEPGLHRVHHPGYPPVSEIVFVHALNGDAVNTWTGISNPRVCWPRDLLAYDMSRCAIWIYSYDARIDMTGHSDKPVMLDLERFADDLRINVEQQTTAPLIWVAHSLGGLVVKAALTRSRARQPQGLTYQGQNQQIHSRTQGALFLGTPHSGSSPSSRSAAFANILSVFSGFRPATRHQGLAVELRLDSTITRITSDFAALVDRKGFPVVSLFETKHMLTESGPRKIVECFADLKHPSEEVGELEGNHVTMCRFETREERGYQDVLKYLKDINQDLRPSFPSRWHHRRTPSAALSVSKATSVSDAETTDVGTLYTRLRLKVDAPVVTWTSVKKRSHKEGTWFLATGGFQDWLDNKNAKPLLIRGPVGCGKTMIAESILEDLRARSVRQRLTSRTCHLHFFFRSDQIAQQSPVAILQAFIAQALDQNNALARHVHRASVKLDDNNKASQALLKGTLRRMLDDTCWANVYLVVDALDECDTSFVQSSYDILSWMFDVPKLHAIFTVSPDNQYRIRATSEDTLWASEPLCAMLQKALEERDREFEPVELRKHPPWIHAVQKYIDDRLGINSGINSGDVDIPIDLSQDSRQLLKAKLLSLPHVSFSVVDLALQHLNYVRKPSKSNSSDPDWFSEYLEELHDMTKMYSILIDLANRQPWPCLPILSILSCAQRPLRPFELAAVVRFYLQSKDTVDELLPKITTLDMQRLVTIDGEGVHLSSDMVRQAIQRQMHLNDGPAEANGGHRHLGNAFGDYQSVHRGIASACLHILLQSYEWRNDETKSETLQLRGRTFPATDYAEKHWVYHLREAGQSAIELNKLVEKYYHGRHSPGNSPVREPRDARSSRLFRRLTEDNLSANLGSIFGDEAENIGFPDPNEIDRVLNTLGTVPAADTLRTLHKLSSGVSSDGGADNLHRRLKLLIVIDINERIDADLKQHVSAYNFSFEDRMYFLHVAIEADNIKAVDLILEQFRRSSLQPPGSARSGLLKTAVQFQNRRLVQHMLGYKELFDLNSGLIAAINFPNSGICEDLLAHGANVNHTTESGESPLHLAAATGLRDLVTLLLKWNASVDATDSKGRTALHLAAESGHKDVVRDLLNNSASLTAEDGAKRTAFFVACACGEDRETAKLLCSAGAKLEDTDSFGRSVLHAAAKAGREELVEMLLSAGVPTELRDQHQITPLHEAAEGGWAPIVERLLNAGASQGSTSTGGMTSLHFACTSQDAPESAVQVLLERGADLTVRDTAGRTPMLIAAHFSTVRVLKLFVERDIKFLWDTDSEGRGVREYVEMLDQLQRKINNDPMLKLSESDKKQLSERRANRLEKKAYLQNFNFEKPALGALEWDVDDGRSLAMKVSSKAKGQGFD